MSKPNVRSGTRNPKLRSVAEPPRANSFDDVLGHERQYSCSSRSREQLQGAQPVAQHKQHQESEGGEQYHQGDRSQRCHVDWQRMVSHGVRIFATASRIALSMAPTSPSINSLVMRTKIRNASAAPPNHRERRPARAETNGYDLTSAADRGPSN